MSVHREPEIFDGADLLNSLITEDDLSGYLFQGVQFDHSNIVGVSENSSFVRCRFTAATVGEGGLRNCYFENSDLSHVEATDSDFTESQFDFCNISDARFVETKMFGVIVSSCLLAKTEFLECDLSYSIFSDCSFRDVRLDDSDLSGADLSTCIDLKTEQLEVAIGNSETQLPPGIDRPISWYTSAVLGDLESTTPSQRPAPLRVMWRHSKIVRDPRGGGDDILNDGHVFSVLRTARDEVQKLLSTPGFNHPIIEPIREIGRQLAGGIHGLNPITLGLKVDMLEEAIKVYSDELLADRLAGVLMAHRTLSLLANQFPTWRQLKLNSVAIEPERASEIANALKRLAEALERETALFDRSVSDSIAAQANDVEKATIDTPAKGAIDSSSNIFARLLGAINTKSKRAGDVALEESTKFLIRKWLENNWETIADLAARAPQALSWLLKFPP